MMFTYRGWRSSLRSESFLKRYFRAMRVLIGALVLFAVLLFYPTEARCADLGREVAIARHLQNGEEFTLGLTNLVAFGKKLFEANWTRQEGGGRPLTKGNGESLSDPNAPLRFPRNFNSVSGPDANSCAGCHNVPISGGSGDIVANISILSQRFDFATFANRDAVPTKGAIDERGTNVTLQSIGNSRATVGLFGSGFIEMLARQMTDELRVIRNSLQPGESKPLLAKGVSFGTLARHADGRWDVSKVEGISAPSLDTNGAPLGPRLTIRPFHQVGNVISIRQFSINGLEYTTAAFFDDPDSDLRIWKVRGRFAKFAELYPQTDEVGKDLMVFGRGTQRGSEVTIPGLPGSAAKGWHWGFPDGLKRWGQNRVGGLASRSGGPVTGDGVSFGEAGDLLKVPFDADAGPNEAHLSAGDSGGGLFIQDGGTWKLAGINFLVDGLYNTDDTGPGFQAAIFDEGGLYKGREGDWTRIPNSRANIPGAFYATRISVRLNWINTILAQTASDDGPILQSAPTVTGPFEDEINADVNMSSGIVTLPAPSGVRFYRLNSASELRIIGLTLQNGNLVFQYR